MHRRRRLGDRPQLHRLRTRSPTAPPPSCTRAPRHAADPTGTDPAGWARTGGDIIDRYGVTILYTGADRDPDLHEVGRQEPRAPRPVVAAGAGTVGEPINPRRGCGTTATSAAGAARSSTRGGRPRPAPDDQPAAGPDRHQARLGVPAPAGHRRRAGRRRRQAPCGGGYLTSPGPGRRCCAASGATRTLPVDTYWSALRWPVLRRRRRQVGRRLPVGARPGRRRHERVRVTASPPAEVESRWSTTRRWPRRRSSMPPTPPPARPSSATSSCGQLHRPRSCARRSRQHVSTNSAPPGPRPSSWSPICPRPARKIMRRLLRDVVEGRELGDTTTLAGATVVEAIREGAATSTETRSRPPGGRTRAYPARRADVGSDFSNWLWRDDPLDAATSIVFDMDGVLSNAMHPPASGLSTPVVTGSRSSRRAATTSLIDEVAQLLDVLDTGLQIVSHGPTDPGAAPDAGVARPVRAALGRVDHAGSTATTWPPGISSSARSTSCDTGVTSCSWPFRGRPGNVADVPRRGRPVHLHPLRLLQLGASRPCLPAL